MYCSGVLLLFLPCNLFSFDFTAAILALAVVPVMPVVVAVVLVRTEPESHVRGWVG